jgi:hypothetical protein
MRTMSGINQRSCGLVDLFYNVPKLFPGIKIVTDIRFKQKKAFYAHIPHAYYYY